MDNFVARFCHALGGRKRGLKDVTEEENGKGPPYSKRIVFRVGRGEGDEGKLK